MNHNLNIKVINKPCVDFNHRIVQCIDIVFKEMSKNNILFPNNTKNGKK